MRVPLEIIIAAALFAALPLAPSGARVPFFIRSAASASKSGLARAAAIPAGSVIVSALAVLAAKQITARSEEPVGVTLPEDVTPPIFRQNVIWLPAPFAERLTTVVCAPAWATGYLPCCGKCSFSEACLSTTNQIAFDSSHIEDSIRTKKKRLCMPMGLFRKAKTFKNTGFLMACVERSRSGSFVGCGSSLPRLISLDSKAAVNEPVVASPLFCCELFW